MNPALTAVGGATAAVVWLLLPAGVPHRFHMENRGATPNRRQWLHWNRKREVNTQSLIFTEVSALLRIGIPPGAAWRRAAGVAVDELGVPFPEPLGELVGTRPASAMIAASRLALTLGAPLSGVLLNISNTLTADDDANAEREAAFAGPKTTARVLLALPLLGLALGWLLGGSPIAIITGGGLGSLSVLLGLALLGVGRLWINRLIRQAQNSARAGT
ncbi:MAG: hypothetical protein FWG25_02125 [Promicromonosporaceae bacterium]|nr:hypothetical protein [Promicromonosporaceae bacterium]